MDMEFFAYVFFAALTVTSFAVGVWLTKGTPRED